MSLATSLKSVSLGIRFRFNRQKLFTITYFIKLKWEVYIDMTHQEQKRLFWQHKL